MTIPYSDRYEKSVLSSMFNSQNLDGEEELTDDHFHLPSNREIFLIIEKKPRPLDFVRITEELQQSGELEKLGGPSFISEIYTFAPTASHFSHHVKELHKLRARRHAIRAAQELIEKSEDLTDEEGFIDAAGSPMSLVSDLASAASNTREKKHILKDLMDEMVDRINGKSSAMGWTTALAEIDRAIKGIHPERMLIISGYPTSGKTVLAIQLCWQMAKINVPALIISLEMPDHKIAERNLIMSSSLPALAISEPFEYAEANGAGKPTKDQLRKLRRGIEAIRDSPIYFEDPTGASINQMVAIIRRNVRKHGVRVVAIDYLQLIKASVKHFSKEQEVADISHTFQALAKELKISIILLSQQNKDGGTKYAEATAEDADAILTIMQNRDTSSDDFGKHIGIGVRKDRHHGNTGDFLPIILNKTMLRFEEMAHDEQIEKGFMKSSSVKWGEN